FSCLTARPPTPTPFPYTTLFRSDEHHRRRPEPEHVDGSGRIALKTRHDEQNPDCQRRSDRLRQQTHTEPPSRPRSAPSAPPSGTSEAEDRQGRHHQGRQRETDIDERRHWNA